mmetsp:Transcript_26426/g.63031  ORF Transcript_26426/g.63031 Transcript_26426/m.63031 type:complete len:202 (+) Transcript_26426:105-710(+)
MQSCSGLLRQDNAVPRMQPQPLLRLLKSPSGDGGRPAELPGRSARPGHRGLLQGLLPEAVLARLLQTRGRLRGSWRRWGHHLGLRARGRWKPRDVQTPRPRHGSEELQVCAHGSAGPRRAHGRRADHGLGPPGHRPGHPRICATLCIWHEADLHRRVPGWLRRNGAAWEVSGSGVHGHHHHVRAERGRWPRRCCFHGAVGL